MPIIILLGGLLTLYFFAPTEHSFYGTCVFRSVTGLDCAGCGTLRGTHALLHGHFKEAFGYNALFVGAVPILLFGLSIELGLIKREGRLYRIYQYITRWWIIVIVVIGWTILRNLV